MRFKVIIERKDTYKSYQLPLYKVRIRAQTMTIFSPI